MDPSYTHLSYSGIKNLYRFPLVELFPVPVAIVVVTHSQEIHFLCEREHDGNDFHLCDFGFYNDMCTNMNIRNYCRVVHIGYIPFPRESHLL